VDCLENGEYVIANPTSEHFAKWLESKKLAVERILAAHGPVQPRHAHGDTK
jgi:hypothetical protein